jgi:regulator of ribonuclease activity A
MSSPSSLYSSKNMFRLKWLFFQNSNYSHSGWSGVIIFGFIRDSSEIRNINIGVKALGTVPRKTEKLNLGYRDIIVEFAATRFIPGEYVYCDLDGIIVCKEKLHSS